MYLGILDYFQLCIEDMRMAIGRSISGFKKQVVYEYELLRCLRLRNALGRAWVIGPLLTGRARRAGSGLALTMRTDQLGEANVAALRAALGRLDQLLARAVAVAESRYGPEATADPYRGLYIDEHQVERMLAREPGEPLWSDGAAPDLRTRPVISAMTPAITPDTIPSAGTHDRALDTKQLGSVPPAVVQKPPMPSRIDTLQTRFGLSTLDTEILLVAFAPEVDLRYEHVYAYLQNDVTRKRPTVDLALDLLCTSFEEKLEARSRLLPGAPLIDRGLIEVVPDPADPHAPLLRRALRLDERMVAYLLGSDAVDQRLAPYVRLLPSTPALQPLTLPDTVRSCLDAWARRMSDNAHRNPGTAVILYVHGPYGVGKTTAAHDLARKLGTNLLGVAGNNLPTLDLPTFRNTLHLLLREVDLQGATLYWEHFDALNDERMIPYQTALLEVLSGMLATEGGRSGLAILAGTTPWWPKRLPPHVQFGQIDFPLPNSAARARLWDAALADVRTSGPIERADLANKFRFSEGQIRDAVATARQLAGRDGQANPAVSAKHVYEACRRLAGGGLGKLAQRIVPRHRWEDLVLPQDQLEHLRDMCARVVHRGQVYEAWGFERKLPSGRGLHVLFSGPSGTGKTMAAEVIAGHLDLELYKIDVSHVVSKYIGETEKQLAQIFAAAESSDAILFFDEADALFGKRSEVRDAHDRYANIETSYLLQRIEAYDGITILATNFRKNMDDAFIRRLAMIVPFPFPEPEERRRIWERVWPAELPRADDIDLDFLARQFELTGGNIKNIAVAAAFLAAEDGGALHMRHLIVATKRELRKMGQTCVDADFGPYRNLIAVRSECASEGRGDGDS